MSDLLTFKSATSQKNFVAMLDETLPTEQDTLRLARSRLMRPRLAVYINGLRGEPIGGIVPDLAEVEHRPCDLGSSHVRILNRCSLAAVERFD